MMMRISHLVVFSVIFLSSLLQAQQYTAEYIMDQIRKTYSSVDGASAQFQQTVSLRFGKPGQGQVQRGTVKIKKGNKYRIETQDQLVITDGKTIWVISKLQKQVLIDTIKDYRNSFSPDKLLLGMPEDFSITDVAQEKDLLKVTLKALSKRSRSYHSTAITAWVRPQTWIVERVIYTDRNQHQYEVTLSQIQLHQQFGDEEFRYIPEGTMKVIDLRNVR